MYWKLQFVSIAIYLFSYVLIFRNLQVFLRERMILMYHAIPFCFTLILLMAGIYLKTLDLATILGLLSLQLIYSMTFLEVWSLAEGSYSLQILLHIHKVSPAQTLSVISDTQLIGTEKKKTRLEHLIRMRLIKKTNLYEMKLTYFGRILNWFFCTIKLLNNIKDAG